MVWHRALVS